MASCVASNVIFLSLHNCRRRRPRDEGAEVIYGARHLWELWNTEETNIKCGWNGLHVWMVQRKDIWIAMRAWGAASLAVGYYYCSSFRRLGCAPALSIYHYLSCTISVIQSRNNNNEPPVHAIPLLPRLADHPLFLVVVHDDAEGNGTSGWWWQLISHMNQRTANNLCWFIMQTVPPAHIHGPLLVNTFDYGMASFAVCV